MIKFDADNKLIWKRMLPENVPTYIHFLNTERGRHMVERDICDRKAIDALHERPVNKLLAALWESAHERHVQDVADIDKLVREMKEYFEVKEQCV